MKTDILIIGSGCSGLYCALHLDSEKKITMLSKGSLDKSDSYLAQGGMCMLKNEEDYDKIELGDTLKLENIKSLIENGGEVILINETKGVSIPLVSDFSERQRKLLSAGGLLNYTSKSVNK